DAAPERIERQVVDEHLRPVLEEQRHPMPVPIARGGIGGAEAQHRRPPLGVAQLDPVRVIDAAGGGRRAEEGVVGRRPGRVHERVEGRVHGHRLWRGWACLSMSRALTARGRGGRIMARMPATDRYGLPSSTASPTAAPHYQRGMDLLLSSGRGAGEAFESALVADEGLAVAHAGRALFALFLGDADTARSAMALARARVEGVSRRERQHVAGVSALVAGETARGLALIDEHVAEFPRDALLVNQASSSIGLGGRADREASRAAFLERLAPAFGEDWWFLSALGFVYHETGRFAESRRLSERSLALYPANAKASHNIAHICFETLDNEGGAAFLSDWLRR